MNPTIIRDFLLRTTCASPDEITVTPFRLGIKAEIFHEIVNYFTTRHPADLTLQDIVDMSDGVITFVGDERWIEDIPPNGNLVSRDFERMILAER